MHMMPRAMPCANMAGTYHRGTHSSLLQQRYIHILPMKHNGNNCLIRLEDKFFACIVTHLSSRCFIIQLRHTLLINYD